MTSLVAGRNLPKVATSAPNWGKAKPKLLRTFQVIDLESKKQEIEIVDFPNVHLKKFLEDEGYMLYGLVGISDSKLRDPINVTLTTEWLSKLDMKSRYTLLRKPINL